MISAQNLVLNVVSPADVSKDTQKSSQSDSLDLTINHNELKKDDSKKDDSIDPNAFTMVMNQVFSNIPEQAPTNPASTNSTSSVADAQNLNMDLLNGVDAKQPNSNELVAQVQQNMLKSLDESNAQPETDTLQELTTQQTDPSMDPNQINDNPALSWIESESFQSMAVTAEQTQPAIKKAANEERPLLMSNINSSSAQTPIQTQTDKGTIDLTPVASAVNDATTASTPNPVSMPASDSSKENMMQSLQQLTAGVTFAATETVKKTELQSQDLAKAANNVQAPLTLNQPLHTPINQSKILEISTPVSDPQWSNKLSDHIVWLGQNDIKSAVIKIHPEELGPLEINVKVVKDTASVSIVSHSAQVRDIVDQAIPRLRDMMSEQGLHLSDVQVNADTRSSQFAQSGNSGNGQQHETASTVSEADEEVQLVTSVKKGPKRLVDYFA